MLSDAVVLSSTDEKILRFLLKEGIQVPERLIAKKLRINPATLSYKLNKFKAQKVLLGSRYRVNPFKIGMREMVLCFIVLKKKANPLRVENFLMRHKNVQSVIGISGEYDLMAKIFGRTGEECDDFLKKTEISLADDVDKINFIHVFEPHKLHQKIVEAKDLKPARLSATDRQIINFSVENPSTTIKQIARGTGLHRNTVALRWKSLWRGNVFMKKSIRVAPEFYSQLGLDFKVLLFVEVETGHREELAKKLASLDEIHELFSVAAEHDLVAVARARNSQEYFNFVRGVYRMPWLNKTRTYLIFDSREKSFKDL